MEYYFTMKIATAVYNNVDESQALIFRKRSQTQRNVFCMLPFY